ncbi:MAG: DNA topoisomerase [Lachnospiraceae bacterium]|nr:DNA topoisomerase [Lachnospiraceae bacterium]
MKLIVCEKPSVAQAYAGALGIYKRRDGYLEGKGYLITWCVGHLVELAGPEEYDEKFGKWSLDDLPILPERLSGGWRYHVSPSTGKQFRIVKSLMQRPDVEGIIEATDAGREGELIFRLVYHQCRCRKPFERLWLSSMEDSAIREGFAHLRPSKEYDALYEAALCRERADWIVGINATRLFSCLYQTTLNVGRVMTPALAMVVRRETDIRTFQSETFYRVVLTLDDFTAVSTTMKKEEAELLKEEAVKKCSARVQSITKKEKSEKPPALYDLTTLQREANRIHGYTAKQTLDYAQSLYEKKLITYPRTDSRFLTEDMEDHVNSLMQVFMKIYPDSKALFSDTEVHPERIMDNHKVTDHHAIIPTISVRNTVFEELPAGEKNVLELVICCMMCAVGTPYRYEETVVDLVCADRIFSSKGKVVREYGWKKIKQFFKSICDRDTDSSGAACEKDDRIFPEIDEGDVLPVKNIFIKTGQTRPPQHFTEGTLLLAMEHAGDEWQRAEGYELPEDFRQGMEYRGTDTEPDSETEQEYFNGEQAHRGLGTPATRAGIIEKLVQKGFLERKGNRKARYLIPTDKGNALAAVMPEQIRSASMTADWEQKLLKIEHGDYLPDAFMKEIENMIDELVRTYETVEGADGLMNEKKVIGRCPHCGSEVTERPKSWSCSNRSCRFALWKDNAFFKKIGKQLTEEIAEEMLHTGRVRLNNCKSQRTGRNYSCILNLTAEEDGRSHFEMSFDDKS